MTAAHDPMCPYLKPEQDRDPNDYCACDLIALARADERERIVAELEGPARESEAMYAHAEAVAARLVEVAGYDLPYVGPLEDAPEGLLDQEYDAGYGSPDRPMWTAWSATHVGFGVEYDGATGSGAVLRNPPVVGGDGDKEQPADYSESMRHDPMCPVLGVGYEASTFCYCERLRERDARVRADERERIVAELEGPARESEAMYAHAEAVAAKLVEVVCEQDDLIQIVGVDATNHRAAAADMRRERDAARADERERIAQAIEEFHAAECGPPESPWPHVCTCVTAAAIARGEVLL